MRPVVGLMMTRNEADIIEEVLASWRRLAIPILALDDSDDGTLDLLRRDPNVFALRQTDICGRRSSGSVHWMYQVLLDEKRRRFGHDTWVLISLGDEIWYHHPLKIVRDMEREGAVILRCRMCNHLLHPEDRDRWDFDRGAWREPFASWARVDRVPYYTAHWFESRGFLDRPGLTYRIWPAWTRRDAGVLPKNLRGREYSRHPLIRHHSVRDPVQAIARAKDRVERGFQEAYRPYYYQKSPRDVFYPSFDDGAIALRKFTGTYDEYENGLEDLRSDTTAAVVPTVE